ncbi:MAG: glycosyltransferase [Porphyromonadaceae bacterium]|nr:glycosyltransferase [Porphyromonadaceae bacterium]
MLLSIIVPVYNRPDEVRELIVSLTRQAMHDYELIIVEDGSSLPCRAEVEHYAPLLPSYTYISISNGGPSKARNAGARIATGDYLLILDSDVVLPGGFLLTVESSLRRTGADAWGGPDAAAPDFSPMQKAVSYAMTSFWTTGGIRGGRASGMERFKPRTFNMGCRRDLFLSLGGFSEDMRYGEDIEFSLRLVASGARVLLFADAYVYHKRRVDLRQFFMQVYRSGQARIELQRRHPGSLRLVHTLPVAFTFFSLLCFLSVVGSAPLIFYAALIFVDALRQNGLDWAVALRAVPASFVQLWGYGLGFIRATLLPSSPLYTV